VPAGPVTAATLDQTLAAFHQEHQRLYTYASPELPVELVNLRVSALGPAWPFTPGALAAEGVTIASPSASRAVYFPALGGFVDCPVYDYALLRPGFHVMGPAILTQELTTTVVEPQHRARLDPYGNILMEIPPSA
jgi:N-methylhydantoinase A